MEIQVKKNLKLRPIRPEDAYDFFTFASNEKVTKFLSYQPHKNLEETRKIIKDIFLPKENPLSKLAIEKDGKMIGMCNLVHAKSFSEIGYQLNPDYWNQKIMSNCLIAFINYYFKYHPDQKIYIWARPNNKRSWAIINKFGFLPSDKLKEDEAFADVPIERRQMYYHDQYSWSKKQFKII